MNTNNSANQSADESWLLQMKSELRNSTQLLSKKYNFDFELSIPNPDKAQKICWIDSREKEFRTIQPKFSHYIQETSTIRPLTVLLYTTKQII